MKAVRRLRGMYDISQESWLRKKNLEHSLLNLIGSFGYRFLDMPILEPTELFLRKSGGDLASQIYGFTDTGSNRVSLRPEFTSSIMRHYVEHAEETTLPARWQYCGPVFRYGSDSPALNSGAGQFTQIGAELIGSDDVLADAELLSLALQVPARIGLKDIQVELADMEVLYSILDVLQLSDRASNFVVSSVPQLKEGLTALPAVLERARQLHLVGHSSREESLSLAIVGLDDAQARNVLHGFLDWSGADTPGLGQRSPEQVVDRLLRKLQVSDELGRLEQGLSLVMQLVAIRGEPAAALKEAQSVVQQAGSDTAALKRLAQLLEIVDCAQKVVLDFGLVRGLAYYNGIFFDVKHPRCDGSLGGGGRYDGLSRALGSAQPVPSLGFAYNLDMLQHAVESGDDTQSNTQARCTGDTDSVSALFSWNSTVLVSPDDQASYRNALRVADQMRQNGSLVALDVTGKGLHDNLSYASRQGIQQVIIVSQSGEPVPHDVG